MCFFFLLNFSTVFLGATVGVAIVDGVAGVTDDVTALTGVLGITLEMILLG
jgi:hypothetical protein